MRNEKKSYLFSKPSNILTRKLTPSIYAILGHETIDIERIPVNQTLLTFKDKLVEKKYFEGLFYDHETYESPSKDFKVNLFIFFLYFSLFFITTMISNILRYLDISMPVSFLIFKTIFLCSTSTLVYLALYLLLKSQRIFRNSIQILTLLGILIIFTIVITDDLVLSHIMCYELEYYSITPLLVISFIYLLKLLLFDNFRGVLTLSIFTISIFMIKSVIFRSTSVYQDMHETFMIFTILVLICVNSYRYEHLTRDIF